MFAKLNTDTPVPNAPTNPSLRFGFVLPTNKKRKWWPDFCAEATERNIALHPIDMQQPLEQQGPFDIIFHKLTPLVAAEAYDQSARNALAAFDRYCAAHPETLVIDPLSAVRAVNDRELLAARMGNDQHTPGRGLHQPRRLLIEQSASLAEYHRMVAAAGLRFPAVAKPIVADGTPESHDMALVYSVDGLLNLKMPLLLQEYISHDATLFKVYSLGSHVSLVRRPSLDNIDLEHKLATVGAVEHFGRISNASDDDDAPAELRPDELPDPPMARLQEIAALVRSRVGVHLCGVDVIRDRVDGELYVIDVNFYPGFYGVKRFGHEMMNFLLDSLNEHRNSTAASVPAVAVAVAPGADRDLLPIAVGVGFPMPAAAAASS